MAGAEEPLSLANQRHRWELPFDKTAQAVFDGIGLVENEIAIAGPVLLEMREGPVSSTASALVVVSTEGTVYFITAVRPDAEGGRGPGHECGPALGIHSRGQVGGTPVMVAC